MLEVVAEWFLWAMGCTGVLYGLCMGGGVHLSPYKPKHLKRCLKGCQAASQDVGSYGEGGEEVYWVPPVKCL